MKLCTLCDNGLISHNAIVLVHYAHKPQYDSSYTQAPHNTPQTG